MKQPLPTYTAWPAPTASELRACDTRVSPEDVRALRTPPTSAPTPEPPVYYGVLGTWVVIVAATILFWTAIFAGLLWLLERQP